MFLYKEYNDGLAYGEEYTALFYKKEDAVKKLRKSVEEYFRNAFTLEELADKYADSDVFKEDYASFFDGDTCSFWVVEELTPVGNPVLDVPTTLGTLRAEAGGDSDYPGIYISIVEKSGKEVVLALAEVPNEEKAFHIRPYVSSFENDFDEDMMRIEGWISREAPMDDIRVPEEGFRKYWDP